MLCQRKLTSMLNQLNQYRIFQFKTAMAILTISKHNCAYKYYDQHCRCQMIKSYKVNPRYTNETVYSNCITVSGHKNACT